MNRPWMKFYPTDWRAEPRLRMCSLAARGLWIDLISYMHEGDPYGYLTINGVVPGVDDMAALVSRPAKEVQKAFNELEAKQVFSVDEGSGAIYSRRMVRDHDRSEEGREQANKRWANSKPNRSPTGDPNGSPNRSETNDLLLRSQKEKKDAASAASESPLPEKELFARGKEVAGKEAGGLIVNLLKVKKGNVSLARAAVEMASTKENPREYLAAIVNGGQASTDGRRLTNDEAYWGIGRTPGIT